MNFIVELHLHFFLFFFLLHANFTNRFCLPFTIFFIFIILFYFLNFNVINFNPIINCFLLLFSLRTVFVVVNLCKHNNFF